MSSAGLITDSQLLSYWVCEKSDGVRVLLYIQTVDAATQHVYLVNAQPVPLRKLLAELTSSHRNPNRLTDTIAFALLPGSSSLIMNNQLSPYEILSWTESLY